MPIYDIATTAFAVSAPRKWVDNLTSHHQLPGITSRARGVSREISFDGVVLVSVVRALCEDLQVPVWRAAEIARSVVGPESKQALTLPGGLVLTIDSDVLASHVRQRLLEAAESVPRIRRGRRPGNPPLTNPAP